LLVRNWGEEEDYRYAEMRQKHGERFVFVSLLTVFTLQGVLMWIVSWPVQFGQLETVSSLGVLDAVGVVIWSVGVLFDAVGDHQLARFKARPENRRKVLDSGLWRYTRHPNYFGDFCVWWGLYLVATSGGAWWTAVGPLLMSYLLLRFSGVSLLESTIVSRRPEYRSYIERTNAFFPGRPREV
jgi:steroid 5-alpha reductase family enzyme